MSLKFRKVKRKVLSGVDKDKTKTYGVAKTSGICNLDMLCELISARSTVSSADVKAVLDLFNWAIGIELRRGSVVQLGEFGNFRLSLSSEGTEKDEDFDASKIKKARIIFTPGASLRASREKTTFTPDDVLMMEVEKECDKEHIM